MLTFWNFWALSWRGLAANASSSWDVYSPYTPSHIQDIILWEARAAWRGHTKENWGMLVNSSHWNSTRQPACTARHASEPCGMFHTSWTPRWLLSQLILCGAIQSTHQSPVNQRTGEREWNHHCFNWPGFGVVCMQQKRAKTDRKPIYSV
jgi:hypothetical protein